MLLLALAACGSEKDAGTGTLDEGFDIDSATLTDEPFCDRIDPATVAELLDLSPSEVEEQVDPTVDARSTGNACVLGSPTSRLVVTVQPGATAEDVQQTVDELARLSGKGSAEVCEPTDASAFGDPSGAFACESRRSGQQRVVVTGLVGDSKFFCAASVPAAAGTGLAERTATVCRGTLEALAAG